jgi:N-acetylneuraminate synthase
MDLRVGNRVIGPGHAPLVIAEIGINHEGSFDKAIQMIDDAHAAGCECVKFQSHVIEDEMIPNHVISGNAKESIWDILSRCAFDEKQDILIKRYVDGKGLIYLSTPFSRAAAERLERMQVPWYKIGSGECNNYPLIDHVASYGKPIIVSTGMNDLRSIAPAVAVLRRRRVPFALLQSTSMYPTPYEKVRLGGMTALGREFSDAVLGLSDHSLGNYTCFAAVALGASIVEKHFTSDKTWTGPDVPVSIDPRELADLVTGTRAIFAAAGGTKEILPEEQPTIDFAYACVVATRDIGEGEVFGHDNLWVKRPGTGEIKAAHYEVLLGRRARRAVRMNDQLKWQDIATDGQAVVSSNSSVRVPA